MPRVISVAIQDSPAYRSTLFDDHQVNLISDSYEATTEEIDASWMKPFLDYILHDILPADKFEAQKIQLKSRRYTVVDGQLYMRSASGHWQIGRAHV